VGLDVSKCVLAQVYLRMERCPKRRVPGNHSRNEGGHIATQSSRSSSRFLEEL
jgi:hypothetical protein